MPPFDGQDDQVGDQLARRGAVILPAAYQSAQRADDLDVEDRGGLETASVSASRSAAPDPGSVSAVTATLASRTYPLTSRAGPVRRAPRQRRRT